MFPVATVRIEDDVLKKLVKTLENLPVAYVRAYDRRTQRVRAAMLNDLQAEPGAPTYPIDWTTTRQRIAFFASDGFGQGIPTTRTHRLTQAWKVTYTALGKGGGMITASNNDPARPFVIGDYQQRFHRNTGWYYQEEIFRQYGELLTDIAVDTWRSWQELE